MKITKKRIIIALILWVAIPTVLYGSAGFIKAILPLQVIGTIALTIYVVGKYKLGSLPESKIDPSQYRKYRRAWRNRP